MALILALVFVSSGVAWALDSHQEVLVGQVVSADGSHQNHAPDSVLYDHCDHADAHMLALPICSGGTVSFFVSAGYRAADVRHVSVRLSPATPPPLG